MALINVHKMTELGSLEAMGVEVGKALTFTTGTSPSIVNVPTTATGTGNTSWWLLNLGKQYSSALINNNQALMTAFKEDGTSISCPAGTTTDVSDCVIAAVLLGDGTSTITFTPKA